MIKALLEKARKHGEPFALEYGVDGTYIAYRVYPPNENLSSYFVVKEESYRNSFYMEYTENEIDEAVNQFKILCGWI